MSTRQLVDRFGRRATDLRLSVTDVCNLRCTYCLPATGVHWLPRTTILSVDELARLAHLGIEHLGITKVRLTGGEPLVRPDLEDIARAISTPHPGLDLALTTNGVGLAARAGALADAGVARVNISLDTVHAEVFRDLTRRDGLDQVLAGIDAALAAGLGPVKINSVVLRGVNDDGVGDLLTFCLDRGVELRFIEQMPIGATREWARDNLVDAAEIRERLQRTPDEGGAGVTLHPLPGRGAAPAERFEVRRGDQLLGTVGIIASVTEPFCHACDRTRISADGQLRSCLFSFDETDLRTLLREGADDEAILDAWCATMAAKPRAHGHDRGGFGLGYLQPARPMNAIGG